MLTLEMTRALIRCAFNPDDETLTPGGRAVPGEEFYEFHVDEDSLWNCVYQAYCKKSSE